MLMWAMSDRAIPRSYRTMQGFGVHTFRLVNAARRVALRQVPLDAARRARTRWCGTRRSRSRGADSGLPSPRSVGGDRGRRRSGVRAGPADLHRGTGRRLHLRRARRDQDRARGAGAGRAGRPAGAEPQPRQLLRRDRAGRVLHRARRARASTSPTIRCSPAASTPTSTRRSRGSAAPTSTRSRSTRRSRRCTTTSATACTARRSIAAASPTSPTRSAAAVRSRRATAGFVSFPEPTRDGRPQGPRQGRNASPITTRRRRCSGTARRRRAAPHRQRVPLRAVAGADAGDPRADGVGPDERRARAGRGRGRGAGHA